MQKNNKILLVLILIFNIINITILSSDTFSKDLENSFEKNLIKNQPKDRFVNKIKLQILDKITGKTSQVDVEIKTKVIFEKLEIIPILCWKSYPEESPESKLLLKIYEKKSKTKKLIFFGWIFLSSPSISGLEHSLYDVTLIDCVREN